MFLIIKEKCAEKDYL